MAKAKLGPKDLGQIAGSIADKALGKIDFSVKLTRADFRKRWAHVQAAMKQKDYDLAYACGSELDRSDCAWLAGVFDPIIERYGVLIPAEGKPIILAGSEGGHVMAEACDLSGAELAILQEFKISDEEYRHARFETIVNVLRRARVPHGPLVAILSSGEALPVSQYTHLANTFGVKNLTFDGRLLAELKYEKTSKELAIMGEANKIADAAFRAMLAATRPGVRESQVAGVGDFVLKTLGAHRTGVPTIVTSGDRGDTVIGPATDKVIRSGDIVSLGVSPTWHGYHGIVRRTVCVGKDWNAGQRAFMEAVEGLYRTVWEATEAAAARNLDANTIDAAGKRHLAKVQLKDVKGKLRGVEEPYSYIHNMGCSECQEGYGAVTGWSKGPLGKRLALAIDCALMGFERRGRPIFPVPYAVVEDALWKNSRKVGGYNRTPISVQHLVGNEKAITKKDQHPCHRLPE